MLRSHSLTAAAARPEAGGHHDPVERQFGGITDSRLDIAFLDRALAERVEGELLHLGARQSAVGTEPGHQQRPCVGRDLQLGRRQNFADHAFQVACLVREAGNGGRIGGLFEQTAQGIVGAQVAGFDDQEALQPTAFDQRLQHGGVDAPSDRGAHDLAPAEHRRGLQLDGDAARILVQAGIVHAQDLAGRIFTFGETLGQGRGSFGDQARVGAIQQHGRWQAGGGLLEASSGTRRLGGS